jgi:hypothetical protein
LIQISYTASPNLHDILVGFDPVCEVKAEIRRRQFDGTRCNGRPALLRQVSEALPDFHLDTIGP